MGTFSHTPHAKEKTLRETWRPRHEIEQHTRTCSVRLLAPPQPSTGRCNDCLFTKDVKNQEIKHNQCDCLPRLQCEPLLDLLFLRSSHSDDWLPQLFGSVQYFFVSTKSLSCFCRRWTGDRRWDKRKHKHRRSDNVTVVQSQWLCDS